MTLKFVLPSSISIVKIPVAPPKALAPNFSNERGNINLVIAVQLVNALAPISLTLEGNLKTSLKYAPTNALSPITSNPSLNLTSWRSPWALTQLNAPEPIFLKVDGNLKVLIAKFS